MIDLLIVGFLCGTVGFCLGALGMANFLRSQPRRSRPQPRNVARVRIQL